MSVRALLLVWLLMTAAGARAQALEIVAPPDRFAGPGEYVTLVFRLTAIELLEAEVSATTVRGWPILRQSGVVRLEPNRSTPVAVTVEVPTDAPAFAEESVRLAVEVGGARFERSVVLTITGVVDLELEAPREFVLGTGDLVVSVTNRGNAPDDVVVELSRGAEVVGSTSARLEAGASEAFAFAPVDDGAHVVLLRGGRGGELRRGIVVVRFGAPEPGPITLAADLVAGVTGRGSAHSAFTVKGALSDFATLDARVDAPGWGRSFAEIAVAGGAVRIGGGWRDPFGLGLPSGVGLAGVRSGDRWGVAAALGHLSDDRYTGVVAGSWGWTSTTLAGGVGVADGLPLLAVRAEHVAPELRMSASAGWGGSGLAVVVAAEFGDESGLYDLRWQAQGLATPDARLDVAGRLSAGDDRLYADASWAPGEAASWTGRFGVAAAVPSTGAGAWRWGAQLGHRESFLEVGHRVDLGAGWRVASAVGVRHDAGGFGVTLDVGGAYAGSGFLAADARLSYHPASDRLRGRVGARYQIEADAWTVNAAASWDVAEGAVGATAAVGWRDGPWRAEFEASLGFAPGPDASGAWSAAASLHSGYAFALPLGPRVVDAFGGRRLGTIAGRVVAGATDALAAQVLVIDAAAVDAVASPGEGLAGVVVEVGRYRVVTDGAGAFTIDLPPGRYRATIVAATLPVAYQLRTEPSAEVEVRVRETTAVVWCVDRTTVLTGRVLEDRDGDGAADDPPRGVAARVLVTDAEGRRRVLATDAEGSFTARGMLPGAVEVLLLDVAAGATVLGEGRKTVRLASGEPAYVEFLVQPVVAIARAFVPQALRIRDVALEAERVPPAAAPLVRVDVQGEALGVDIVTGALRVPLSWADGVWLGRVPVPADAAEGVWPFAVIARDADGEVSRRTQVLVDPEAALVTLENDQPVRAGSDLRLTLTAYAAVDAVVVASPFGGSLELREVEPGRWTGALAVPDDTADAVWELEAEVALADGRTLVLQTRFRVLAPP